MIQHSRQRILWIGVPVILILIGLGVAFPYRYLFLSRLNVGAPTDSARMLGLRQVADIPLPGGASRLDYASIDPNRALLFIAHLGAGDVIAFDFKRQQVAADIPDVASVHGVIAVPQLHRVYAAATGTNQIAVIDEDGWRVIAHTEGGDYPDGLAFDDGLRRLYVASESGFVSVFQERGAALDKTGEAFLAPNAHTIAVDSTTHRVYVPLENIDGRPVLRILEPLQEATQ